MKQKMVSGTSFSLSFFSSLPAGFVWLYKNPFLRPVECACSIKVTQTCGRSSSSAETQRCIVGSSLTDNMKAVAVFLQVLCYLVVTHGGWACSIKVRQTQTQRCIVGSSLTDNMKAVAVFFQVLCYVVVTHAWTCTVPPQHYPAKQMDAGQGMVVMTDERNRTYVLSGSTWQNLGTVQLKHVSVGPAGIWGVDSSNTVYKYVSGDFVPSQGRSMQQVDAGGAGEIVGISFFNSFCLASNYASAFSQNSFLNWASLSSRLMYISCGPLYGCWGTDSANLIYVTQAITPSTCEASCWSVVDGFAIKVEVGTDGNVFVLNSQGDIYQRTGISSATPQGTGWNQIPMCSTIKDVTYDLGQLWAITTGGVILKCSQ